MDFDLIVVGAGSGGVRAARMAAQSGKTVAIIEKQDLGGTCVNVGCVPKKLFVYAAHYAHDLQDAQSFGWSANKPDFNWKTLVDNKNAEIKRLNEIYGRMLENAKVTVIRGEARLTDKHSVLVSGKTLRAEKILIATGSKAFIPDFPGNQLVECSESMFYLEHLPKKILVVGGGFIAVEFAGIFNALGVETHLCYRGELLLRGFDVDVRKHLLKEMTARGIHIHLNQNVTAVEKTDDGLLSYFDKGNQRIFDKILFATGRIPNTDGLGLADLGVQMNSNGAIQVDDYFKTNIDSIYALGDVIDRVQLTPVAIEEAMVLVDHLYGSQKKQMIYSNIPCAVFSLPNIAKVGLSEEEAQQIAIVQGFDIEVFESHFRVLKYTMSPNPQYFYMKLIVNKQNQKVLGVHMLGDEAAEIIQGLAVALTAGATKQDFDNTIGIHPSSAEEFVTMRTSRA